MDSGHKEKSSRPGSCLRPGIQESDTGDSGEESEPTYRHYDNFETDVCLTQDEDDDMDVASSIIPNVVHDVGKNLDAVGSGSPATSVRSKLLNGGTNRDPFPTKPPGVLDPGAKSARGVSSDSDSCTESEQTTVPDAATDDTTTATSTSESEETQIWVPVSKRSSARQLADTTTPPASGTSSNGSDGSRPQSYLQKASSPGPLGTGSLPYIASAALERVSGRKGSRSGRAGSSDCARRDSRDSWHTLQANLQSSGVQKRMSPTKQMSAVGLLRHDEATGTITLDIRNVPNGDPGLSQEDERGTSGGEEHVVIGTLSSAHAQSGTAPRFQQPLVFTRMSFCETMCVLWSALYMVCVVVVGLMVPIAEIFVGEAVPVLFEGYYIYMYVVSISFLAYVYSYVLRMRTMPRKMHSRTIVSSVPVARKRGTVANAGRQTGSFYLRLGAVVFGITSMIKSGLHFGEYFEMTSSRNCDHVLYGIRPIVHLCFTFAQLYFVFLNSQMMTRCYGYLARFGLMHMVATNVAVWLQEVVRETLRELGRSGGSWNNYRNDSGASYDQVSQPLTGPTCQGDSLMGDVVVTSSPYLYPCSVMYSLICAAVLFVMWLRLNDKINTSEAGDQQSSKSSERSNVDCSSSSRGLFLGIIIFVAAVIILITFFVLVQTDQYINTAVRLDHLGDVALYVVTIVAVILVFYRTFGLRYSDQETGPGFEDALLVLSLLGVYVLCVSNVLAAVLATDARSSHLVILSNCLRAFQASLQTAYLLNTLRRRVWRQGQAENKSGREFVTFLLLSNVALWGMSVFEVQRAEANPLQANFYGHVTWNVITHVSLPLAIMFRFHSTVCLANIWKHAWRLKG